MKLPAALLALVVLSCLAGCSQGLESKRFQTRMIRSTSADEVFNAAQVVLRREFGRLNVEPESRRIVSEPVEYRAASGSGTARDLYGGASTMRRIAELAVVPRDEGVLVRLRVEIERRDTDRRESFQPEHGRLSDAPGRTPIERDAATTTKQNTVWTFVKRDRAIERALLAELQGKFGPEPGQEIRPASDRPADTP